jgi:hypothetical protein
VERWGQPAIPALSVLKLQPKNDAVDYNSRMAIFRPGSQPAQGMRAQKSKLLLSSGVSALIIVLCYLLYGHIENTGWFGWALREFIFVLASLSLLVTILSLIGFFSRSAKTRSGEQEYEITPAGIARHYPGLPDLFVPTDQIVSFQLRKNRLIIWLQKPPKALVLHSHLLGFEEIPHLLAAMGIPKQDRRPPVFYSAALRLIALLAPAMVCCLVLFRGTKPLYVALAGIGFLALMGWFTLSQRPSPYTRRAPMPRRWSQRITLALWVFVVATRVWTVSHPNANRHVHAAHPSSQPCPADQTRPATPPSNQHP